jgi:urease accessory protein
VPDAADVLSVYLLSPTGGVVDGDHYQFDLCLEAGTHALVTTQAATKVYRTPTDGATQQARITVGEGATLELLPDALILFAGADYAQETQITLAPGALLMLHEIVMPGRLARGEVLAFRRFRSRLTVRDQAGLLLVDAVDYAPDPGDAARPGLLDGGPCWGSWYLLGDLAGRGVDATAFCTAHQAALEATPGAVAGISPLWRGGVTARALAPTTAPLYAAFSLLWAAARAEMMGLPAGVIRK